MDQGNKCPTCQREKGTFEAPYWGDDEEGECARCVDGDIGTVLAATSEWMEMYAMLVGGDPDKVVPHTRE